MALVNSAFTVNVTPGAMPPIVHVSEYDTGRTYTVTINGENGGAFVIPTGASATIEGTLNGEIGFSTTATIANNAVSFTLTESMTAVSGKAWCKIKLTLNDEPIQTCAFVLAVDRAGVEAETVIGASGFEQQIVDAVNDWLDEHPPASGGMTEAFKQALLDCFENVAWINDQGQTYYDALYAALYPQKTVVSISAAFNQGSAVIYETDSLDTLKQYLTVTAYYDDSSTGVVTNYTLSGTLTVGTSTITVSYGGKTTTFNVTVTEGGLPQEYQEVEWVGATLTSRTLGPYINTGFTESEKAGMAGYDLTFDAAVDAALIDLNGAVNPIVSFSSNSACYFGSIRITGFNTYRMGMGSADSSQYMDSSVTVGERHSFHLYWDSSSLHAESEGVSCVRAFVAGSADLHLRIGTGTWQLESSGGFKVYGNVIIKKDNAKVSELVPCYRKADGVIGFYDLMRGSFFTNAGSGDFEKGADV